jgi:hypothetical protein
MQPTALAGPNSNGQNIRKRPAHRRTLSQSSPSSSAKSVALKSYACALPVKNDGIVPVNFCAMVSRKMNNEVFATVAKAEAMLKDAYGPAWLEALYRRYEKDTGAPMNAVAKLAAIEREVGRLEAMRALPVRQRLIAQYNEIADPVARGQFYAAHEKEMFGGR